MTTSKLNQYLEAWQLSDPRPLAQTVTSDLYTVHSNGQQVVLKLLTDIGFEERAGAVALQCFGGHGAVRLLHHDEHAQLLEYVDGTDLVPMVKRGDDEEATMIIAGVLNKIHSAYSGPQPEGLYPLPRWFKSLFDKAEQDQQAGDVSIFVRAVPLVKDLLAHPRDEAVLHGDIHHENIRYHEQRGWLAFDPKGLYGERTYDAANTLCNPTDMDDFVANEARILRNAEILSQHLNIELSRVLAYTFAYTCLSAAWSLSSDQDASVALRIAEIAERHLV